MTLYFRRWTIKSHSPRYEIGPIKVNMAQVTSGEFVRFDWLGHSEWEVMHCAFRRPFYVAPPENGAIAFGRIKNIPMGTDVFASCCVVMLRVASWCFVMLRVASWRVVMLRVASCCVVMLRVASWCFVLLRVASCCFVMRRDADVVVEVSLVLISSYLSSL